MRYRIERAAISDIGLVRQNNEDVFAELLHLPFFILADGMGGHKAGEIAAKLAVDHLADFIENKLMSFERLTTDKVIGFLYQGIAQANAWVHSQADLSEHFTGMGTTLCCFLLHEDSLIYAHVGDSRIYRFRKNLHRLTIDHSLKHELIAKGKLDEEQAQSFPYKNVITRAIGPSSNVEPDISMTTVAPGDIYFLCSDGLTDHVSDEEIAELLEITSTIEACCQACVDLAKAKGGSDNITIVMIKIHP